jgi:hypothetical protein
MNGAAPSNKYGGSGYLDWPFEVAPAISLSRGTCRGVGLCKGGTRGGAETHSIPARIVKDSPTTRKGDSR